MLAVRRPDLVGGIVTLGSPQLDPFAIHPLVLLQVGIVGALGTLGVPGLFTQSCWRGECCSQFGEHLSGPFPADVRSVSVYSKSDGVVKWQACLDPAAEHVEVGASHCGMAVSAPVYRAIADVLPAAAAPAVAYSRAA